MRRTRRIRAEAAAGLGEVGAETVDDEPGIIAKQR